MYSYGWRQYMPDLGRWIGIDQLAESYLSTSPYAYVANNPVSQFDVDGRWFNADGSIDTSGRTPGFTSGRQMYSQFLGQRPGDGGGNGSYTPFGRTQAYSDLMDAFYNGGTGELVNQNGTLKWWTDYDDPDASVKGIGALGMLKLKENAVTDWYGPGGKGNWFLGTSATAIGYVEGSFRLTNGAYNGNAFSPKYYPSGWLGGSRARISTYSIGKIAKGLGRASVAIGFAMDAKGVQIYNSDPTSSNAVHPNKAILNTIMGVVGSEGGSYGAMLSTLYFGIDNFYPGGWVGASETAARTEANEQQTTGHPFFSNSALKF